MHRQRGNIVIYLLVGMVLFGMLLTGIWWTKTRVSRAVTTPQAVQPTVDKTVETTLDQDSRAPVQDTTKATPSPDTTSAQPAAPAYPSQTSSTATTTPSAAPTKPESQTPRTAAAGPVAASGPVEDSLVSAALLGSVAYATTMYVRSRRQSGAIANS